MEMKPAMQDPAMMAAMSFLPVMAPVTKRHYRSGSVVGADLDGARGNRGFTFHRQR